MLKQHNGQSRQPAGACNPVDAVFGSPRCYAYSLDQNPQTVLTDMLRALSEDKQIEPSFLALCKIRWFLKLHLQVDMLL